MTLTSELVREAFLRILARENLALAAGLEEAMPLEKEEEAGFEQENGIPRLQSQKEASMYREGAE